MSPERLYEDERYRLTLFRGRGDGRRLAVGFEHGRKDADEFMPASFPRYAQRLGIDALIVQTARRDWYISDRSQALSEALRHHTRAWPEVVATGFSMGGYAVLLYSADCHARRVLAVSPHYCIDPAIAPFDPGRRLKFEAIGQPMPRPETRGDPGVAGLVLYDPAIRVDRIHAGMITEAFPNLLRLALPYGGHPATSVIGVAGGIGGIAEMVVEDRLDPAAIREMHRANRRRAGSYRLNLARAALARHPRPAIEELRRLAQSAAPHLRFEAGMALLDHDDDEAAELLMTLFEELPGEPPPTWRRQLERALRKF